MKVPVLQVNDVEISKFRWWSDWIDIAVFDFAGNGHLLQMKISRRNSKRFKTIPFSGFPPRVSTNDVIDLTGISNS